MAKKVASTMIPKIIAKLFMVTPSLSNELRALDSIHKQGICHKVV
jgi:hypothetical protein